MAGGLVVGSNGPVDPLPHQTAPPPPPPPPPQNVRPRQVQSAQVQSAQVQPQKQSFMQRAQQGFQHGVQTARGTVAQFAPAPTQQYAPTQQAPMQYVPTQQYAPQQQYAQQQAPPAQSVSGVRKGAIGFSLLSGLFPLPFNPLFLPIQMTIFIIMIIVLLFKGYSFWTAALLSWLIPGLIAAVIHYMFLSGVLSIMGYGEAISEV